ncbi:MAG: hypothetical protein KAS62_12740 [Candidatus Delongbacteria bacterium]|nr:hypothetical protein [Candidatus Delongbacteria bacterium]
MFKKVLFLIPLVLSFVLMAKSLESRSSNTNRTNQSMNDTHNRVELSRSVNTDYVASDETKVYKEIQYAKKLYRNGEHIKAKNILRILKKDEDRALSEKAHYLCLKWYNNLFISIEASDDTEYAIDTKELDNFKKKFPRSKYISELEYFFKKDLSTFNSINRKSKNANKVDLSESYPIRYNNDSTYTCTFHSKFRSKDSKEHDVIIVVSGKIKKYEPWGKLQDYTGSKGLIIDDNSRISIKIDNEEKIVVQNYVEYRQQPQYEVKKIKEWGIESEKRAITETNAENTTQLATYLTEDLIMPNFKVQFVYGKMNELVPEESEDSEDILNDRFNSECYVELKLNEFDY